MSDLKLSHQKTFDWLQNQQAEMLAKTIKWANINTGSGNYTGLMSFADMLRTEFSCLGEVEQIELPERIMLSDTGVETSHKSPPILRINRPNPGKRSVLLVAHYDTVYAINDSFQTCEISDGQLNGPGVADLKGGMVVMLYALQALQKSGLMDELGIEILLNPDEEIGSPASGAYITERAQYHDVGFIVEPALADGTLVGARKGSGNFSLRVKGRAAHAGREIELGRNALVHLMQVLTEIEALNGARNELTINIAQIVGGGALNTVPDMAVGRFNCRLNTKPDSAWFTQELQNIVAEYNQQSGYEVSLFGGMTRNPKPATKANRNLQNFITDTGNQLAMDVAFKHTGGVCDGNNMAQAGLPNVDTLGVRGGSIHSPNEYMIIESLTERAEFLALILMRMAAGEFNYIRDVEKKR
ncbi:MAG: hydrolase [Rhizobiales bacterium]|nr:hydrolase [Hyphomicrobiales bacterium]NRB14365.1 hydrolase [Hyphomicrobiales bacterium]